MLNEIFSSPLNIGGIVAVRQKWKNGEKFSYLERPRKSDGLLLLTGACAETFIPGSDTLKAEVGDVLLLPEGSNYRIGFSSLQGSKSFTTHLVNFCPKYENGEKADLGNKPVLLRHDEGDLLPLFSQAADLYLGGSAALLKATVYKLIGTLFPLCEYDGLNLNYIDLHYTEGIKIPLLAKMSAMNETAYRRRFREKTGVSPKKYVNDKKLSLACRMLENDEFSISYISDYLNFYSLPYFYKVFKEYAGMTPAEYRASRREEPHIGE